MNDYVLELIKSKNNNFNEQSNTAHLFYAINNNGGTGSNEIDYDVAEKIEINGIYQDKRFNLYHIMGKQYDSNNNIILLCKEVV